MTQPLYVSSVTVAAPDPRALAAFYQRMLGWTMTADDPPRPGEPAEAGWAQLAAPPGTPGLMRLNFEFEAEYTAPAWPSVEGRQHITAHLDIPARDVDAAVTRALEAGARLAEVQPQEDVRVLIDPAGHPFCLFQA